MSLTGEEKSISMYYDHGIAEWHEKSLILTDEERDIIEKSIFEENTNELVKLVKLPFPKFVESYFGRYASAAKFLKDPEFAYKVYLLPDKYKEFLIANIRRREASCKVSIPNFSEHALIEGKSILETPLEGALRLSSAVKEYRGVEQKFLYLTQYLNQSEIERLGLSIGERFKCDAEYSGSFVDGYELFSKLEILNPVPRYIMSRAIGLFGHERKSLSQISKDLGLVYNRVLELYSTLVPCFLLSLGDLKVKTGYIERDYYPGETREYTNKTYRDLDIFLSTHFMYNFFLTPVERVPITSAKGKITSVGLIYLAHRFMFKDEEKTARYMTSTPSAVKEIVGKLK